MSKIEWTGKTWNPIVGCTVVSPGCTNCYAMRMAARLERMGQAQYAGLTRPTKAGPVWTGDVRLVDKALTLPLRTRKPTTWFVNSMSDLFHEGVSDAWIDRVFAVMALCPQHTFQVLTKRSARMRAYLNDTETHGRIALSALHLAPAGLNISDSCLIFHPGHRPSHYFEGRWPLPNVWLGVSTEDQRRADERVPDLLATPAAVRFVSAEPLLGPIDFLAVEWPGLDGHRVDVLRKGFWTEAGAHPFSGKAASAGAPKGWFTNHSDMPGRIDWLIVGGESGPGARPMHPAWAKSIRDQCAAAGVPFFHKQNGAFEVAVDRDKDDPDWRRDYSRTLNDRRPEIEWLNVEGGRGFHGEGFHVMRRVGKARAGRHLDGVLHDGMPGGRV